MNIHILLNTGNPKRRGAARHYQSAADVDGEDDDTDQLISQPMAMMHSRASTTASNTSTETDDDGNPIDSLAYAMRLAARLNPLVESPRPKSPPPSSVLSDAAVVAAARSPRQLVVKTPTKPTIRKPPTNPTSPTPKYPSLSKENMTATPRSTMSSPPFAMSPSPARRSINGSATAVTPRAVAMRPPTPPKPRQTSRTMSPLPVRSTLTLTLPVGSSSTFNPRQTIRQTHSEPKSPVPCATRTASLPTAMLKSPPLLPVSPMPSKRSYELTQSNLNLPASPTPSDNVDFEGLLSPHRVVPQPPSSPPQNLTPRKMMRSAPKLQSPPRCVVSLSMAARNISPLPFSPTPPSPSPKTTVPQKREKNKNPLTPVPMTPVGNRVPTTVTSRPMTAELSPLPFSMSPSPTAVPAKRAYLLPPSVAPSSAPRTARTENSPWTTTTTFGVSPLPFGATGPPNASYAPPSPATVPAPSTKKQGRSAVASSSVRRPIPLPPSPSPALAQRVPSEPSPSVDEARRPTWRAAQAGHGGYDASSSSSYTEMTVRTESRAAPPHDLAIEKSSSSSSFHVERDRQIAASALMAMARLDLDEDEEEIEDGEIEDNATESTEIMEEGEDDVDVEETSSAYYYYRTVDASSEEEDINETSSSHHTETTTTTEACEGEEEVVYTEEEDGEGDDEYFEQSIGAAGDSYPQYEESLANEQSDDDFAGNLSAQSSSMSSDMFGHASFYGDTTIDDDDRNEDQSLSYYEEEVIDGIQYQSEVEQMVETNDNQDAKSYTDHEDDYDDDDDDDDEDDVYEPKELYFDLVVDMDNPSDVSDHTESEVPLDTNRTAPDVQKISSASKLARNDPIKNHPDRDWVHAEKEDLVLFDLTSASVLKSLADSHNKRHMHQQQHRRKQQHQPTAATSIPSATAIAVAPRAGAAVTATPMRKKGYYKTTGLGGVFESPIPSTPTTAMMSPMTPGEDDLSPFGGAAAAASPGTTTTTTSSPLRKQQQQQQRRQSRLHRPGRTAA